MRRFFAGLVLLAAVSMFVGCASEVEPEGEALEPSPAMRRHEFTHRLDAARLISDTGRRDEALASVVRDAAAVGRTEAVKQAIESSTPGRSRNELAASAAIKLASVNAGAGALTVAGMIDDITLRDDTLSRIAKGQTKP